MASRTVARVRKHSVNKKKGAASRPLPYIPSILPHVGAESFNERLRCCRHLRDLLGHFLGGHDVLAHPQLFRLKPKGESDELREV
jgi:hypothetical protein